MADDQGHRYPLWLFNCLAQGAWRIALVAYVIRRDRFLS